MAGGLCARPCPGNATSPGDPPAFIEKVIGVATWTPFKRESSGKLKTKRSRSGDSVKGPALPPDQAPRGHLDKVRPRSPAVDGVQKGNSGGRPLPPVPPRSKYVRPRSPLPLRYRVRMMDLVTDNFSLPTPQSRRVRPTGRLCLEDHVSPTGFRLQAGFQATTVTWHPSSWGYG